MHAYSKPVLRLSTIQSASFVQLVHDYERELIRAGYNHVVARLHLHPDLRRGVFQVEDKLIAWLSGRKLSGVNPWEDPVNSQLATPNS